VIRSFDQLALRQMGARPLRAGLTAMAVALGVGMVFGVLLLSGTVRHTFDELIGSAWGTTDLVVSPANNAGTLPDQTLATTRSTQGVANAGAMIGASLRRLDGDGRAIRGAAGQMWVAGFDPSQAAPYDFRYVQGRPMRAGDEIVVERSWAADRGLHLGDRIPVLTPTGRAELRITGIFSFSAGLSFGGQGLAGIPLATARRLFDQPEGYATISVRLRDRGQVGLVRKRLEARLGGAVQVETPSEVAGDVKQQLQALDVVLMLFSGMALFVGGFLILNSFTMTVLQRTRELGMLRTLGAGRRAVARSVLTEAVVLAIAGTLAGLALGIAMALGLIALLRGLEVPVGNLHVSAGSALAASGAGIVATLLGAALPARRAARVSPIQAAQGGGTEAGGRPRARRLALALALFLPGLLLGGDYWFGGQGDTGLVWAVGGIGGTMAMFAGMVMAAPFVIPPLVAALALPLCRLFPTTGRLAADAARANPRRTAATAIALSVGLSVVVVNATMAHSFVSTIGNQITAGYERDLTVRPLGAGLEQGGAQVVPRRAAREISALPQAGVVTPLRVAIVDLPRLQQNRKGLVEGIDPAAWGRVDRSAVTGATREQALRGVAAGGAIVASAYAQRARLHVGDTLVLRGPRGERRVRVAALLETVTDFGGQLIQISQDSMREVYGITADAQLVIRARSAAERKPLEATVQRLVDRRYPGLESLSTAEVKDDIAAEVDKQFNLFNAIVAIAVLVSLLGVVNTLAMSVLERTREIGVLRALGASRWHVRWTMVLESVLVTLSGAIAGLLPGFLIAWVWSRSLGDMLPGLVFSIPISMMVAVALAAVVLGALAAVLPARRAARMDVVRALSAAD
jgi:putative ABC transport system permease protein